MLVLECSEEKVGQRFSFIMQQSEAAAAAPRVCVCVTLLCVFSGLQGIRTSCLRLRIRSFCVDMLLQLQRVCVYVLTQAVSLLLSLAEGLSHHSTLRLLPLLLSMFL